MVYLFVGQDALSKEARLNKIKNETLPPAIAAFNTDTIYGKETGLKILQEKLLALPCKAAKRLLIIKGADHLKDESRKFLIEYVKKPFPYLDLVLDIEQYKPQKDFISSMEKYAQLIRFKEELSVDTFTLSRLIDAKKAQASLKLLRLLVKEGERPERIIGGLRSHWERTLHIRHELQKRVKFLLDADVDIKTGRLKPVCALEKCVICLCNL